MPPGIILPSPVPERRPEIARPAPFWAASIVLWVVLALWLGVRPGRAVPAHLERPGPQARPVPQKDRAVPPKRGPSILLVTLDTTRPDHLGCYGYARAQTPATDSLAREGVRFTQAVASVPITLPSHASIMLSRIPPVHGVRVNGATVVSPEEVSLAEVLHDAGYRTAAFVSSMVLHRRFGLAQGFDLYDDDVHRAPDGVPLMWSERYADEVTGAALGWLDGVRKEERFFAWVHYYDPHLEYVPPAPYDSIFAGSPYDGEIAFTDAELGRLLQGLRTRGLWENTLVVVASDHGESLGEHGESAHTIFVYDATQRVALIIDHPQARRTEGKPSAWRGRVMDEQVQLLDVAPTILDLVGLTAPAAMEGRSLVPLVLGKETGSSRPAYGESCQGFDSYGWARLRSWRTGRWKYIHGAREELYDLARDPGERENLSAREPELARRHRSELEAAVMAAAAKATPPAPLALDRESVERLRSLGYVGTGSSALRDSSETDFAADASRPDPVSLISLQEDLMLPALEDGRHGDFPAARQLVLQLLAADPRNKLGLSFLGDVELELGNLPRAREAVEQVVSLDPGGELSLRTLATVVRAQGDIQLAIDYLRQAVALVPINPEAHEMLGTALREKGDLEAAIAEYELAVSQDPGFTRAHYHLGLAYEQQKRPDRAVASYRAGLRLAPQNVEMLINMANLCAVHAPVGRALPLYRRALAIMAPSARGSTYANMGNALSSMGEHRQAVKAYREALRLGPETAQTHYALGCSLAFLGDKESARAEWRRALELNPSHEAARTNLDRFPG